METHDHDNEDPVDQLIARRLARLGTAPVDTSKLDHALRARISSPAPAWRRAFGPLAAVAAGLILVAAIGIMLFSGRNALASAADMAQMHRDMVSGRIATMKVDSMEQANEAIAAFAENFPQLSESPQAHTMACCMRDVGNKKVACVLLSNQDTPVTVVVANADAVRPPSIPATMHRGQTYYVQAFGNLNMIMSERQHHWICFIGELPSDKLMDLSSGLKFSTTP